VATERQVTFAPHGHILTNAAVWSRDGRRIVYDVRSDPAGNTFDGDRIETVDVETGEIRLVYQSVRGAKCGVATYSPTADRVVFILGPEDPTPDFTYGPARRRGVMVDEDGAGELIPLDARDLAPPFTSGALRGGSHVHMFSPDGSRVSFTYEDNALDRSPGERNQRNVGVSLLGRPVRVPPTHPRNHDGEAFSVLVTRTWDNPRPGSDEIRKAFEDAWVGTRGYLRPDGTRQRWAIAFQGMVESPKGYSMAEVFIADLPDDLTVSGDGPLQGTSSTRPRPPAGTTQRRLTFTFERKYPGVWYPRHWLRSSPDGSRIAFLQRDDEGIVQIWTVSPNGGPPLQVTRNSFNISSAFTWSPDGRRIAHVAGNRVCVTDADTGRTTRLTLALPPEDFLRPEACVFSPDGNRIAYARPVPTGATLYNQVFVCDVQC
jgi:dipeptidyl aminopeptidase/acylaminoacyl peptidase